MSRYTQRTSSSSLFLEIRTTSVSMMPALSTMPRPGSMMVSGIWLPKCLRSARKIDRPYCRTGGTSLRYLVGNPPPMLTMERLIPRSAQSRNTWEAIARARSQAFTLRCCEPTWKEMPHGSRPRRLARSSTSTAISGSQPNLRGTGNLRALGGAIDRKEADAERECARDITLLLDRVAEGDAVRRGTGGER